MTRASRDSQTICRHRTRKLTISVSLVATLIPRNRSLIHRIHLHRIEKLLRILQIYLLPHEHIEQIRIDVSIQSKIVSSFVALSTTCTGVVIFPQS